MNEESLSVLLREATTDVVADPASAAVAWREASRQSKRARSAAVVGAGLAGVLVTVLAVASRTGQESAPGLTPAAPPTASTTDSAGVDPATKAHADLREVVQDPWEDSAFSTLPVLETPLPSTLSPDTAVARPLADDPVGRALAVVQLHGPRLDLRVLGDDLRWRILNVDDLKIIRSDSEAVSLIRGNPISSDGTQLAIAQPDGLVIVDLTTGRARTYAVPGLDPTVPDYVAPVTQWTPDGTHVLVGATSYPKPPHGWLVDATSGTAEAVPYDAVMTAFAPDGTAVQATNWDCELCELRHFDGTQETGATQMAVGLYVVTPVIEHAMAVSRAVRGWSGSKGVDDQDGLLIVDPATGAPLAQLPIRNFHEAETATLHGWLDDDTVIFTLRTTIPQGIGGLLLAWDYKTAELSRLIEEPYALSNFDVALSVPQL